MASPSLVYRLVLNYAIRCNLTCISEEGGWGGEGRQWVHRFHLWILTKRNCLVRRGGKKKRFASAVQFIPNTHREEAGLCYSNPHTHTHTQEEVGQDGLCGPQGAITPIPPPSKHYLTNTCVGIYTHVHIYIYICIFTRT